MNFLGVLAVLGTTTTYHRRQTEPKGRTHFFLWALSLSFWAVMQHLYPGTLQPDGACSDATVLLLYFHTSRRYKLQEHPCIRTPASTLIVSYRTVLYSLHSEIFFSRSLAISVSLFNLTSLYKSVGYGVAGWYLQFSFSHSYHIISYTSHFLYSHVLGLICAPPVWLRSGNSDDDMSASRITHRPADI